MGELRPDVDGLYLYSVGIENGISSNGDSSEVDESDDWMNNAGADG